MRYKMEVNLNNPVNQTQTHTAPSEKKFHTTALSVDRLEQCTNGASKSEGCCKSLLETLQNLWKSFLDFILCRKGVESDKGSSKSSSSSSSSASIKSEEKKPAPKVDLKTLYPNAEPETIAIISKQPTFIIRNVMIHDLGTGQQVQACIKLTHLSGFRASYTLFINENISGNIQFIIDSVRKKIVIDNEHFSTDDGEDYHNALDLQKKSIACAFIRLAFELSEAAEFVKPIETLGIGNYAALYMMYGFHPDVTRHARIIARSIGDHPLQADITKINLAELGNNNIPMKLKPEATEQWREAIRTNNQDPKIEIGIQENY